MPHEDHLHDLAARAMQHLLDEFADEFDGGVQTGVQAVLIMGAPCGCIEAHGSGDDTRAVLALLTSALQAFVEDLGGTCAVNVQTLPPRGAQGAAS